MLQYIIGILFPPKCVFCGDIIEINMDMHICQCCYAKIPFIKYDFGGIKQKEHTTGCCDRIICVCEYSGIVKKALIRYKFNNKSSYYSAFSALLYQKLENMTNCQKPDVIISIPLYSKKEALRGYNQSFLISRDLSKKLKIPEKSMLVSRIRDTGSQRLLDRSARCFNLKDAFRVKDAKEIKGKVILLVDDILTTGNTLSECSRVLKEAGAKQVIGAVIASGRTY